MNAKKGSPRDKSQLSFSLKDQLFNRERIEFLADRFSASQPDFDRARFVADAMKGLTALELKQRIVHLAACLERVLAVDFRQAAGQIVAALPPPLDPTKTDDDFGDFIFAPLGEFVVRNGLTKQHLKLSLKTLREITMRFSMEDAIRSFINNWPDGVFGTLEKWSTDSNYHVRRLVSEGTRPRLPWSGRLTTDFDRALPLLDQLHADPTRYVTRSVANHLNDIAKIDPPTVLRTLKQWQRQKLQRPAELEWMTRHALRTLVKQGNEPALRLLGFRRDPRIRVTNFYVTPERITAGDAVVIQCELTAERAERLLIDYVVDFVKAGDKRSTKVHKLKSVELAAGESITLKKRHVFRANATTYSLYSGTHHITLQINGQPGPTDSFELDVPE
jgi:3-methyladenine DNA glycosylase AlkC